MKIEKVNDHQIRCTLTKNDLADRELKISELAYGTEKAKSLFRDMMQQAAYQFGFEADDIPLMIEAIPLNSDCIVLIITKVEDPEELDTRFSNFAPSVSEDGEDLEDEDEDFEDAEEIGDTLSTDTDSSSEVLDLFRKLHESKEAKASENPSVKEVSSKPLKESGSNVSRIFSFHTLNDLTRVSSVLNKFYRGTNALYKNTANGRYMLVVYRDHHTPTEFNKVCNTLSEYGYLEKTGSASVAYLEEHYESVIGHDAVNALSQIF